jgi:hypothetical protein
MLLKEEVAVNRHSSMQNAVRFEARPLRQL